MIFSNLQKLLSKGLYLFLDICSVSLSFVLFRAIVLIFENKHSVRLVLWSKRSLHFGLILFGECWFVQSWITVFWSTRIAFSKSLSFLIFAYTSLVFLQLFYKAWIWIYLQFSSKVLSFFSVWWVNKRFNMTHYTFSSDKQWRSKHFCSLLHSSVLKH